MKLYDIVLEKVKIKLNIFSAHVLLTTY
jgi:hypothetical protein